MALQVAQLGSLPYMNLARYVPEHIPIEPAWHKALTAFLVNTAGTTGRDLVSNALSQDYTPQARAMGLPGAAGMSDQDFASKILHGPQWDKSALQEGIRQHSADMRNQLADDRMAKQLGLQQSELDSLNKYREGELAQRQAEQGSREAERKDTASYRDRELAQRAAESSSSAQSRQDQLNAEVQHWKDMISPTANPSLASEMQLRDAQVAHERAMTDPNFAAQTKLATIKALLGDDGFNQMMQGLRGQPSGNNDSVNFHNSGSQTVPGGSLRNPDGSVVDPSKAMSGGFFPSTTPYTQPASVPSFGSSQMDATMRSQQAPVAGTSQQMGQRQMMEAAPVQQSTPPITQPQALQQHVGETISPTDILSLVRPAQTPNSPTAIQPSTAAGSPVMFGMDPQTMARAADLLRRMQASGMGGTPDQSGGGSTGY